MNLAGQKSYSITLFWSEKTAAVDCMTRAFSASVFEDKIGLIRARIVAIMTRYLTTSSTNDQPFVTLIKHV